MKFASHWQTAVLAVAVAGVVGCDPVAQSNKDAVSKINEGVAKLSKADGYKPVDAVTAAHTSLIAAAGIKSAGPGVQAAAAASVAALDQGVGRSAVAPFYQALLETRQTLTTLRGLAIEVAYTNSLANGNKAADPKPAQAKIAEQIAAIQGNAQAANWGTPATVPTLTAVKQETSRLQGEIATQQQKLTDLNKLRSEAIAISETQLKHADSLKGDEAVRAFADGSESRRKADDLAIQIDQSQDALNRAQSDLAIQQGQEKALNEGIAALQGHAKQLDAGWTDAQQRTANQTKIAAGVVDGDDANKLTIKDLSAQLAKQLDDVKSQRTAAIDQLAEADKYFGVAQSQSSSMIKSFADKMTGASKEAKNYKSLADTLLPQQYSLQIGVVRRDAAALIAAEASLIADADATRTMVKAALDAAGQTMPPELAAIDPAVAKTLADDADTRLGESADALTSVESGNAPLPLKNAAKVAHLVTLNARIQLASVKTALGDTAAAAASTQYLSDATALKGDIISAGLTLPALPGDLGTPPAAEAPPTAAPESAPPTPSTPAPTPGAPAPSAAG